jgi:hypothetical protein
MANDLRALGHGSQQTLRLFARQIRRQAPDGARCAPYGFRTARRSAPCDDQSDPQARWYLPWTRKANPASHVAAMATFNDLVLITRNNIPKNQYPQLNNGLLAAGTGLLSPRRLNGR